MPAADPQPPKKPVTAGKKVRFSRGALILLVVLGACCLLLGVLGGLLLFTDVFRSRVVLRVNGVTPSPSPVAGAAPPSTASSAEPAAPTPQPGQSSPGDRQTPAEEEKPQASVAATAASPTSPASPEPAPTLAVAAPPQPLPSAGAGDNPAQPSASASAALPLKAGDDAGLLRKDPEEEKRVRQEVLARVDMLKELTQNEKDHLYSQVERARGFTKLAVVPFGSGQVWPDANQVEHLVSYLRKPSFQQLFEDPTVVVVCAGYADLQGSEAQNLEVSHQRADNMVRILRTKAKIHNLMRAVGMGGSNLFDKNDAAKNRVVEIWLVQP